MATPIENEHFLIEQCPASTNVARTYGGIPRREEKANADLLAAAPELYEALEAIAALDDGDEPFIWRHPRQFKQVHAAIAKARGESQ